MDSVLGGLVKFFILLLSLLVFRTGWTQAIRCEKAHGDVVIQQLINDFRATHAGKGSSALVAVSLLYKLPVNLLAGKQTPNWSDFESLRVISEAFQAGIQDVRSQQGPEGAQKFYQELNQLMSAHTQRRNLGQAVNFSENVNYGPIDYGLRRAYRQEIEKLNRLLPSNVRLELRELPKDLNKEKINQLATEIVTEEEAMVRSLYATSGYQNVVELVETIRAKGNPKVKKSL